MQTQRCAIIEELERLPGNLVACKTTEHLKRIQKAVFVEIIDLKKELRLQLLDIIDERRSLIGELEQRLSTKVMAYKTRQELKCHQKDDMIRAMEMRSTDHGVCINNSMSESDKHTSLGEQVIIPGPAGIVQMAKLRKLVDTRECGEESVMSTQDVIDYVTVVGGIVTSCFGDVKKFLKNGKLEQIVAVIKSCTPNALDDLTVTLKDLSGTIFGTIQYKVLTEERFAKTFTVG
nr:hypothetical protein [Tanacetum cinerariifolium]